MFANAANAAAAARLQQQQPNYTPRWYPFNKGGKKSKRRKSNKNRRTNKRK
jgi:hypothetical protein